MPSGEYLMEDFYYAGGLPVVLRRLGERGLLHKDALTVNGRTIWENVQEAAVLERRVITPFERPFKPERGIAVLRGNLAPDGAVIKPSAASPELMQHTRPRGRVRERRGDARTRSTTTTLDIDESCVMVLKNCGPKGYPGMAEVGNMPLPAQAAGAGVTRHGPHFGRAHVRHRVRHGGAARRARGGGRRPAGAGAERRPDHARRATRARCICTWTRRSLRARRAAWTPPPAHADRGYEKLYVDHVLQANEGVDLDFLVGRTGSPVPRDNH